MMTKELVIEIINKLEQEWWEESKGYNIAWHKFASYKWLKELKNRITNAQESNSNKTR